MEQIDSRQCETDIDMVEALTRSPDLSAFAQPCSAECSAVCQDDKWNLDLAPVPKAPAPQKLHRVIFIAILNFLTESLKAH